MKTISYVGPDSHFNGWDHDATPAHEFTIGPGQTIDVSDQTAAAIAAGHPGEFEIDGKLAGKRPAPGAPPAADDESEAVTVEELLKLDRTTLNQLAAQAGVPEPDKLKTKQDVAEAILAHAPAGQEAA